MVVRVKIVYYIWFVICWGVGVCVVYYSSVVRINGVSSFVLSGGIVSVRVILSRVDMVGGGRCGWCGIGIECMCWKGEGFWLGICEFFVFVGGWFFFMLVVCILMICLCCLLFLVCIFFVRGVC